MFSIAERNFLAMESGWKAKVRRFLTTGANRVCVVTGFCLLPGLAASGRVIETKDATLKGGATRAR